MLPFALVNAWTGATLQLIVIHQLALRRPSRTRWWPTAVIIIPVVLTTVRHPRGSADQDLTPRPTLTDLDQLIKGVRAAGLPIRTTIHGTPALPRAANSPSTEAGPRPHPERGWRVRLHLPEESPQ
ncbi:MULTISPECIES: hypothetical protein [Streptomyces]|uniref:PASTA domain-containing protein n=2 Tax=Streptomyces TaxID=1883 RepID=A0ABV9J454_9ACTN